MSTIVIVEDQAVNRTIYAKIASSIADDVWTRTFGNPREALEALADREQAEVFAPAARPLSNSGCRGQPYESNGDREDFGASGAFRNGGK